MARGNTPHGILSTQSRGSHGDRDLGDLDPFLLFLSLFFFFFFFFFLSLFLSPFFSRTGLRLGVLSLLLLLLL